MSYEVKDSGKRQSFASGMVRDTAEGKTDHLLIRDGPMLERWAVHLTRGAIKYAKRNWMKASGQEELDRFRESAARHFEQWLRGDTDEDHASAVYFGINGAEFVKEKLKNVRNLTTGRCSNDAKPEKPNDPRAVERSESSKGIRSLSGEAARRINESFGKFSPSGGSHYLGSIPPTSPMVEPSQAPAYGASSQATRGYTDDPDTLRKWEDACRKGT